MNRFKIINIININLLSETMNFTQAIWKTSSEIGVGVAKIKGRDKMVVVAQYRPAGNGNMPGEFRKNVPPPLT